MVKSSMSLPPTVNGALHQIYQESNLGVVQPRDVTSISTILGALVWKAAQDKDKTQAVIHEYRDALAADALGL